jgi:putative ribosome biogenesis GTPase RsgA
MFTSLVDHWPGFGKAITDIEPFTDLQIKEVAKKNKKGKHTA